MSAAVPEAVLLDLDGTLTDSGPGIMGCVAYALERMGHPRPSDADLFACVGPPLSVSFARLLPAPERDDPARIDEAIALYRERYVPTGAYENAVYAGIPESLARLRAAGHRLVLCTSKPWVTAERICAHFDLARHLDGLYGAELDGVRGDKTSLIAWVLEQEGLAPVDAVMVGDREHDAHGAAANGVPALGVTWGYGSAAELTAAGCAALAERPSELPRAVVAAAERARTPRS